MKMVQISQRVTAKERDRLKRLAISNGETLQGYILRLIKEDKLRKQPRIIGRD